MKRYFTELEKGSCRTSEFEWALLRDYNRPWGHEDIDCAILETEEMNILLDEFKKLI